MSNLNGKKNRNHQPTYSTLILTLNKIMSKLELAQLFYKL